MTLIRWGIIGPGTIAHNFADGMAQSPQGEITAIASTNDKRRTSFGDRYAIDAKKHHDSYEALCNDNDVDAVYISTPHPFHAAHALLALNAGKHVLCEKPAGLVAGEVVAITEAASRAGVMFMEGFMYRAHPQIARVLELISGGAIGKIRHIKSSFGFNAPFDPASRAYDPALAGGGILDVGCYPVSFARLIAGAATGAPFANPISLRGVGEIAKSGVDQTAYAVLEFADGITAECATAVSMDMDNSATILGSEGSIFLPDPWCPGRDAGPSDSTIEITDATGTRTEQIKDPRHLFAHEADLACQTIIESKPFPDHPGMSWADSIGNAEALDAWRHELNYRLPCETPAGIRQIAGIMPSDLPAMTMHRVDGVDREVSALVMGCDNRDTVAEGALVWDAWIEAGGNAFDTGFVYGGGLHEEVLGHWMAARGIAKEMVVIVKGAHSPYCTPRAIASQLEASLERLQLDRAPIYIMHRDNPDVPVGEFIDALNDLQKAGKIGPFGGSNWSTSRMAEANAYALANGLSPMTILNNNLSLAVMEKPVWDGCVTSNTPETLSYLRDNNVAHFSWSSQARGYFLAEELRNRIPDETGPEACFGSARNAERRKRAETLAAERDVAPLNIATAWVLAQSFPSFALIGPRSPGEIVSTLPGLTVKLSTAETAWLNLEADSR